MPGTYTARGVQTPIPSQKQGAGSVDGKPFIMVVGGWGGVPSSYVGRGFWAHHLQDVWNMHAEQVPKIVKRFSGGAEGRKNVVSPHL